MKWQKRRFETVGDDAVDVLAIEAHLRVAEPKLARNRGVGDEAVVGVHRHAQTEVVVELERVAAQISNRAGLHVGLRTAFEGDAMVVDVVE